MLRWRIALGTLLIFTVTALIVADANLSPPGSIMLPVMLLTSLMASQEMVHLFAARNLLPLPWTIYLGNALVVVSNWLGVWGLSRGPEGALGWPMATLAGGLIVVFLAEMARYDKPGGVTERLAAANLALVYVGLLTTFLCQLRLLGERLGVVALVSLLVVVKLGDIGAYTVGRLVGRHKLVPRLSPGKTWEGFVGGLLFACGGAWLTMHYFYPWWMESAAPPETWRALGFGLLVGLAGAAGDLAESMLKRDLGLKDSSTWLPGFGGVLDILDSILLASPVAYLGWSCGLLGPLSSPQ